MSTYDLNQTSSEERTLATRGYKLLNKLGEGSYAKVYLAEYETETDSVRRTNLACKVIDTAKAPNDFVRKFLPRELDILVKLNHPHIVHVHGIFQRRSKYFIFMRFAENGDLLDFVLKNGPVTETRARVWFRQLTLGLQYLHEMEIAHRDVKCENVLLTSNYNAKLADFGFARYVVDERGKRILSETYCGSLSYAAPEILRGTPYDPKISDIWSLGVILYVTINKAMPFDDSNMKRLYEQQINRKWKFRGKVVDNSSEQVKNIVTKLLEPDCAKRCRIREILNDEWIGMDQRLIVLDPAERAALDSAIASRKQREIERSNRNTKFGKTEDKKKTTTTTTTTTSVRQSMPKMSFKKDSNKRFGKIGDATRTGSSSERIDPGERLGAKTEVTVVQDAKISVVDGSKRFESLENGSFE